MIASPAHAKRVALLIGNSEYQHEIRLPNPVRDTRLLEAQLVKLGFSVERLGNLDKRGMELAINRFVSKSSGADTALVFYAGHGTQPSKGGRSYLLPVNAKVEDDETLEADGVLAEDIATKLEAVSNPAKLRLVILDACRSRTKARGNGRGLAPPRATDSFTLIAYSTKDGETADDGDRTHSPYAQALARNLPRLAQEPVRRVFEAVAKEVREDTDNKQRQYPRTYGDLESDIGLDGRLLASVAPEPARSTVLAPAPTPVPVSAPVQRQALEPELVVIPAGRFTMGSPAGEVGREANEGPQRTVNMRSFELGKTEVTQGQWKAVMGSNPSGFKACGDNCPVEQVSWDDIQQYLQKLNQRTGQQYRLPSEAEWEYAARAGSTGRWNFGDDEGQLGQHAWFTGISGVKTQPVGQKRANAYGLHDMHGNVWEWVQDCFEENYNQGQASDGSAHRGADNACSLRVLRGGSWSGYAQILRAANRGRDTPVNRFNDLGFRVARTVP